RRSLQGPLLDEPAVPRVAERRGGARIGGAATRPGQLSVLMAAAADVVTRAIVHAAVAATSTPGMTSYTERFL
ncbi:MAG: hypothetical protein J2O47_05260, partial [Acidimicrobiaceae bacterium]|nr:hypothetical protein [Acidimicrobiaceae bacterium]